MARRVQDKTLSSKVARQKLTPRRKPYYKEIEPGLHLGYRRLAKGAAGSWVARFYKDRKYALEKIATADDTADSNELSILTFDEAVKLARTKSTERLRNDAGIAGPLTVRQAIDTYVEFLDANRKSGKEARYAADAFILPVLGEIEVAALKSEQIRKWHAGVKNAPARIRTRPGKPQRFKEIVEDDPEYERRRKSTANRILTVLKAALNRAFRDEKTASDAAWRRVEPFEDVDAARARYLSMEESRRFLNACHPDFRRLTRGALETGARYGELGQMRVSDFNPDSKTVAVRRSKSGKARQIHLTNEGHAYFKAITAGRPGTDLIFKKGDGTAWARSHQAEPIELANKHASFDEPVNFHALRHTWASHAVMNGVPLMIVARNLGHSDTRMVEKHYGHLAQSYVAETIRNKAPKFEMAEDSNAQVLGAVP